MLTTGDSWCILVLAVSYFGGLRNWAPLVFKRDAVDIGLASEEGVLASQFELEGKTAPFREDALLDLVLFAA